MAVPRLPGAILRFAGSCSCDLSVCFSWFCFVKVQAVWTLVRCVVCSWAAARRWPSIAMAFLQCFIWEVLPQSARHYSNLICSVSLGNLEIWTAQWMSEEAPYYAIILLIIWMNLIVVPLRKVALCKPFGNELRLSCRASVQHKSQILRDGSTARILGASWHTTPAAVSSNHNAERSALQSCSLLDAVNLNRIWQNKW